MLALRVVIVKHSFKYLHLRFLSTNSAELPSRGTGVNSRKYLKPLLSKVSKPPIGNFLCNLFQDTIDKRILEYPAVLREEEIDVVLNHSSKVEDFFNNNAKSLLTEETLHNLKELELFGLTIPQKYGGAGYNETESTFLIECTGINSTFGRFINYNENYGCKLLNLYGNDEQKEKYLPRLAESRSFISLAYLENGPLVDMSQFVGSAVADEDNNCYILKGEKKWVHNADKADLFLVMLKLPQTIDDYKIRIKFSMFIVEKNTPGIRINKLILPKVEEANMFEVSFNDVIVPQNSLLGSTETNGFTVLKTGLSHCNVADAALCSNLMKQILHDVIQFIQYNNLNDSSVKGYGLIQDNLAFLVMHIYALESVVYFLTGRFDSYENLDLFSESVFAKIIAIESLQFAIQKYIEIIGRESLKKSRILDEAIKAVQYYSVFDENIEFLKMAIGVEGLVSAVPKISQKINAFRRPYDDHKEYFKNIYKFQKESFTGKKLKYNFKMELHSSLSTAADTVERSCEHIENAIINLFVNYGNKALEQEHIIIKLVEKAAYVYAAIACLSRASFSICYDLENFKSDQLIAQVFVQFADSKIEQLFSEETKYLRIQENYRFIGKNTFNNKSYPAEHPLSRTY